MFKLLRRWKLEKLQRKMRSYTEINPDNWPEYKAMFIESLRLACLESCKADIVYWNMLANFRRSQDYVAANMPVVFVTDLFVTLCQLSRKHNPETWAMIDSTFSPMSGAVLPGHR